MERPNANSDEFLSGANKLTALLLLVAPLPWPYSYYIFVRWFIFFSALYHISASFSRRHYLALISFVPIGLLFNPIEPVFLSKEIWSVLDFLAAMFCVIGYEDLKEPKR